MFLLHFAKTFVQQTSTKAYEVAATVVKKKKKSGVKPTPFSDKEFKSALSTFTVRLGENSM